MPELCPCCSGKEYDRCCKPYHLNTENPSTALELMRSRYSGYAKKLSNYIIKTTHPHNPIYQKDKLGWRKSLNFFSQQTEFQKLEILDFIDGKEKAFVTFNAYLRQGGKDVSFNEKSCFLKENERWLYLGGVVKPGISTHESNGA